MKRLIICKICHETLESPIILPCGRTICSKHLFSEMSNSVFKCDLCDNFHNRTQDKFPVNEELSELVQICDEYVNLNSIDLGKEYQQAKERCKYLNDLIKESELLIKEPSIYINNHFIKLKNEINSAKEQLIKDIEQKYEQITKELKEFELKCTLDAPSKQFIRLDDKIKEKNKELMEWSLTLASNFNRSDYCQQIISESTRIISELKYEMKRFQQDLLNNKQYEFNSISYEDSILGDLAVNDVEIIDEARLEGTLRFVIDHFSQFKDTLNERRFNEQWFVINNNPWKVEAIMKKQKDFDIYLSVFTCPSISNECLESKPIKAEFSFKILKTNAQNQLETFVEQSDTQTFEDNSFFGFSKFISLKDIMNPANRIYNRQSDSVTIEVRIKTVE